MILPNHPQLKVWLKRFLEIITFYRIRFHLPPWEKEKIIFTFDDGPMPKTLEILKLLDEHQQKAVFFLVGEQIKKYPEIAREIVKKGHTIGSHGFSHINMKELSLAEFSRQVKKSLEIIEEVCGVKTKYFRPPFRQINWRQMLWLLSHGLIFYSCSGKNTEPRPIILLHDYLPLNIIKDNVSI